MPPPRASLSGTWCGADGLANLAVPVPDTNGMCRWGPHAPALHWDSGGAVGAGASHAPVPNLAVGQAQVERGQGLALPEVGEGCGAGLHNARALQRQIQTRQRRGPAQFAQGGGTVVHNICTRSRSTAIGGGGVGQRGAQGGGGGAGHGAMKRSPRPRRAPKRMPHGNAHDTCIMLLCLVDTLQRRGGTIGGGSCFEVKIHSSGTPPLAAASDRGWNQG